MSSVRPLVKNYGQLNSLVDRRQQRLVAAGFSSTLAMELARDCATDLHALLDLVDRGCPPHLAARILAPLDDEERRCP